MGRGSLAIAVAIAGCVFASCGRSPGGGGGSAGGGTGATAAGSAPSLGAESGDGARGALATAELPATSAGTDGAELPSDGGSAGASSDCICAEGFACVEDALGARCEERELLELGTMPNEFGFAWRDAFMLLPCYDRQVYMCWTIMPQEACPNQSSASEERGTILEETFAIGGKVGALYTAHLVVTGVVEGKYYEGGMRDRGSEFSDIGSKDGADAFHRGGKSIPSSYAVYQVTVRDAEGNEVAHYFLNSVPQASGAEAHFSFPLAYEKDIDVPGGGTIVYRTQKPNCVAIANCTGDAINPCNSFSIPEPGLVLPDSWGGRPLASWNLVNGAQQPFRASLVHLRVTRVARKN